MRISMIKGLSRSAKLAHRPGNNCTAIRQWIFLVIIIFTTWFVIYLPLHYSMRIHPRPDITWMTDQRNMSALVRPDMSTTLMSPRPSGCFKDVFLLIVVLSAVKNINQRQAIRDTWGKAGHWIAGVRIVFLMGRPLPSNETFDLDKLASENSINGDIVQEDFIDSYNNLTVKSVMMLKWITHRCGNVSFVMKTDDDMFVHVPNLIRELQKVRKTKLLLGCLISKAAPVKDWSSKWYVPEEVFPGQLYPDYLSGTGYVMSGDTVPILFKTALSMPFFYLEDIFLTGICAEKAEIKRLDSENFKFYKRKNNACIFRSLVTGHRMSVKELRSIWVKIHDSSVKCVKKIPKKVSMVFKPKSVKNH